MGRPRRLPSPRKQTLRRLAGRVEVPRKRSRDVREVRERTRAVPLRSRSAVQRRLAALRANRDLQNRSQSKEIRGSQEPFPRTGAKNCQPVRPKRLVLARPDVDFLRAAKRPNLRQRQRLGILFSTLILSSVILSEVTASRSEAVTQSKDPYPIDSAKESKGVLPTHSQHRENASQSREEAAPV